MRESKKQHPTKLVKAASCCLLSPLTTTTGWILRGGKCKGLLLKGEGIGVVSKSNRSFQVEGEQH